MGATAALAFTAFGTATSAIGQVRAGSAQARVAEVNAQLVEETAAVNAQLIEEGTEANADILAFNSRMLEAMSRDAIRRGFDEESRFRVGMRGFIGSQRAGYAGQGVVVDEDSSLDVQTDTAYQAEQDALTIRTNAARESWGFRVEAENERMQEAALRKQGRLEADATRRLSRTEALSARMGGNYARSASRAGAASTILGSTADSLYQQYGFRRRTAPRNTGTREVFSY